MLLTACAVLWFVAASNCLECAACINVTIPTDCHTYQTCNVGDRCYTASYGIGMDTYFDMGCRTESECLGTLSSGLVGRSLGQIQCGQCCAIDHCNDKLCSKRVQVTNEVGTCVDDPTYDCVHISTLFNICSDIVHAKSACRKFCGLCDLVDGAWSLWSPWTACDVTCGTGILTRSRTCTDPPPAHGGLPCVGNTTETKQCTLSACPIHGGWGNWQTWNSCSNTCSIGTQSRHRSCDNPVPQLAGNHCFGDNVDFRSCFIKSCADGSWSIWSQWSTCSRGLSMRTRACNNPQPSQFGKVCVGNNEDYVVCDFTDGGWSSWSQWSTCSHGLSTRTRACTNPQPSQFVRDCAGNNEENVGCRHTVAFTVTYPTGTLIDGRPTFNTTITNVGGGYDPSTAKFTCPVSGLYLFTFTVRSDGKYAVTCWLKENGIELIYAQTSRDNIYDTATASTYLQLTVGDVVNLGSITNWDHVPTYRDSSFSGALIES